jgi:DNA-binding Lrp family transcriptional regulator
LPGYIAALRYIEIEKEIANFHLNNIKNGFVGGTLISFNNGQPTLEEQKEIERQIKNKHTGTDNAGGIVLVFSEGKDKEPTVLPLRSNDFDKAFEVLNKTVTQEIFVGHRIPSGQLFGIDNESAFARNVIRDASEFFQNTYITPKQQTIEQVINDFALLLELDNKLTIIPLEIIGVDYSEQFIQAVIPAELLRKKVAERLGINLNEAQTFNKQLTEDEVHAIFDKYGESLEGYEIIHAEAIPTNFATITITTLDKSIIDLLSADNLISNKNIAEALKVDVNKVNEAITRLIDNGMIVINENERNLTKKGENIKKLDSPVEEILVRYIYDKKPGIEGDKIIPTTRDFCRKLLEKQKQYTREQIDAMNNEFGTSVWLTRGGWYHNPQTGLTSTSCRHIWQQVLLRKKA